MGRRGVDPCRVADTVVVGVCWNTARKRVEINWKRRTQLHPSATQLPLNLVLLDRLVV